ncbi:MAG: type II toxin-antitoxin system RelB/DinJ family antitoxin [Patescibacteria group bacterium]
MNYAVVTTKVDPQVKIEAQKIAGELGMPLSVVIKAFLKQLIRTKSLEFSARSEEPSEYLIKTIKQALQDRKEGKASPVFNTGKEAVKWLERQGI